MKTFIIFITVLTKVFASPALEEFISGNHLFTASVYKEAVETVKGNFLICPFSAETVLALTNVAARGETAKQLQRGLNLPENKETIEAAFKELIPAFRDNEYFNLSTANKIFVQNNFTIDEDYRLIAVKVFDAGIESIDFSKSVDAAKNINQWVENQTNNKIHDLIKPEDIGDFTRLVLVNALYFMGQWEKQFEVSLTNKEQFHVSINETKEVDTMHLTDYFNYYESPELKAKFLELPFVGTDIKFTIVLPDEIDGLSALEEKLPAVLSAPKYTNERVKVSLPKFKIESSIDLKEVLKKLGIVKPFETDADFSGFGSDGLYISQVVQKTFIDLNENGVEAAAATAVGVALVSAFIPPQETPKLFIVDRPFLFSIQKSFVNIFVGRIFSPRH